MCGITGWVDHRRDLTAAQAVAQAMTETMACRGPDDEGLYLTAPGGPRAPPARRHRPRGRPSADDTPRAAGTIAVLTYSGEVYNYRELRAELAGRGHRFRTAQRHRGGAARLPGVGRGARRPAERHVRLRRLGRRGPRTLVLVRDRMGIKPLYYHPTADGVLFGSEPKAILANPLVEPRGRRRRAARAARPSSRRRAHAVFRGHARGRARPRRHGRPRRAHRAPLLGAGGRPAHRRPGHHRRAPSASCSTTSSPGSWSPTCRCAPCSPAAWTPVAITALARRACRRRDRRRCAPSPSTSSARPSTSDPTSCAPRPTRRTSHDVAAHVSAPTTATSCCPHRT